NALPVALAMSEHRGTIPGQVYNTDGYTLRAYSEPSYAKTADCASAGTGITRMAVGKLGAASVLLAAGSKLYAYPAGASDLCASKQTLDLTGNVEELRFTDTDGDGAVELLTSAYGLVEIDEISSVSALRDLNGNATADIVVQNTS